MKKQKLAWQLRPSRTKTQILGNRNRWQSACGQFCVDRFSEGTGRFIAQALRWSWRPGWQVLSNHRTLAAAQRACQAFARENQIERKLPDDIPATRYA